GLNAGCEQDELFEVAAVQRQVAHLLLVRELAYGGVGGFYLGGLPLDRHRLGLLADCERKIHHALAADGQCDSAAYDSRESGFGGLEFVLADRQVRQNKSALTA